MAYSTLSAPETSYRGIWVPMITPFKNGDVDYDAAALFAHHLVDAGVHGLVVCGTTGEGPALSALEKARILDTVSAVVAGRIPVFMGLEGASTAKMIAEIAEVGNRQVNGYLLSAPSYVRPSQEGIYRHFMAIADAAKQPVLMYDIPARTGVSMTVETIARLTRSGAFPAIKACGLSEERLDDLLAIPDLKVMCGDDPWIYRALEMGAEGAIAASAQVLPRRFVEAYRFFEKHGSEAAFKWFNTLMPLVQHMFDEPNPAPVKCALAFQRWCPEELRLPMLPVTDSCRNNLHAVLHGMHGLDHDELICADKSSK